MAATSTAFINEVLRLTNQYRAKESLPPLKLNAELNRTAQDHSKDMAQQDYFSHVGLNGSEPWDRAEDNGYTARSTAENIAAGQRSPESVVTGWMNSSGHRRNILNPNYTELGVGYYNLSNDTGSVNYNTYWTQVFGSGDLTPSRPAPKPPSPAPVPKTPDVMASPIAHLKFNEGRGTLARDSSNKGIDNNGKILGGAQWIKSKSNTAGRALNLDGKNDKVVLKSSKNINQGIHDERTVSMWFKADNANSSRKQVIYEEGGHVRGLNAYVKDDLLYFGGWNKAESKWSGSWKSTKVSSNKWHHIALVLDGDKTVKKNALTAYLNGQQVGKMDASQLWGHDSASLGGVSGGTRFHDGAQYSGKGYGLDGAIDEVKIFNDALSSSQVSKLADFM